MGFITVVSLCSGVAVFMFGMLLVKYSLEEGYKEKLSNILKKFTSNRFTGVLTGTFVTAAMQSSSASSVLTAAFVDSGMLSLYRAFWIIVGANLGTTFTGLLTAFSFSEAAPAFTVIGIIFLTFNQNVKLNRTGILFIGLGLLFVAMDIMGEAAKGISELPVISEILSLCNNPFTGIITGCLLTAVIQSSSAVTALLQTLANDGVIGIRHAYFIILGSNIGTCATCAVAAAGLKSGAKKVSLIHIFYNFAGAVLFFIIAEIFPLPEMTEYYVKGGIKTQIAVVNIMFNLVPAVIALFLPIREDYIKNFFSHVRLYKHLHSEKYMLK